MGQRLVLKYNIEPTENNVNTVTIYQHWSGYTEPAIETFETINDWIFDFQITNRFKNLTKQERFDYFVTELGSGNIIERAYFTTDSLESLVQLGFTELENNTELLNRNNGLININEHTNSAVDWADLLSEYDCDDWFSDKFIEPDTDVTNFFNADMITATINDGRNPLNLTIKELVLLQDNAKPLADLEALEYLTDNFNADDINKDVLPNYFNKTLYEYLSTDQSITRGLIVVDSKNLNKSLLNNVGTDRVLLTCNNVATLTIGELYEIIIYSKIC